MFGPRQSKQGNLGNQQPFGAPKAVEHNPHLCAQDSGSKASKAVGFGQAPNWAENALLTQKYRVFTDDGKLLSDNESEEHDTTEDGNHSTYSQDNLEVTHDDPQGHKQVASSPVMLQPQQSGKEKKKTPPESNQQVVKLRPATGYEGRPFAQCYANIRKWVNKGFYSVKSRMTDVVDGDSITHIHHPPPRVEIASRLPGPPLYRTFPDRYARWEDWQQLFFWVVMGLVLGGITIGIFYALPALGLVAAPFHIYQILMAGELAFLAVMYGAILLDGLWSKHRHRAPSSQFFRTLAMLLIGMSCCALVGAWLLPPTFWIDFITTLMPQISQWYLGLKIAVMTIVPLGWGVVVGGLSWACAHVAKSMRREGWHRMAHMLHGMSWGIAIAGAAMPAIFLSYFIAAKTLITSLMLGFGRWAVPVFAAGTPFILGFVMGIANAFWQGGNQRGLDDETIMNQSSMSALIRDGSKPQNAILPPETGQSNNEVAPWDNPGFGDLSKVPEAYRSMLQKNGPLNPLGSERPQGHSTPRKNNQTLPPGTPPQLNRNPCDLNHTIGTPVQGDATELTVTRQNPF